MLLDAESRLLTKLEYSFAWLLGTLSPADDQLSVFAM